MMGATMQAAYVGEDGLEIGDVSRPEPKPQEILVRVRTAALNRADLAVASGAAHGAMGGRGTVPGLEFAGEIAALGSDVTNWKVGDRVMCSGAGGYAEYAVTDYLRALPIPEGFDFDRAATLPLALQTMHNALVENGGMSAGDSVLILGASSGVGLMGQQIARHLGARVVIGSSTDDARRAKLTEFGAHHAISQRAHLFGPVGLACVDGVMCAEFRQFRPARIVGRREIGRASCRERV